MSLSDIVRSLEESFSFHKEVIIGSFKFEITILNYEKDRLISSSTINDEDPLLYYEKSRMAILSHAITGLQGEKIPDIVKVLVEDKEVTKERAIYIREILNKIPFTIVDKLFDIYVDFKDEMDNKLEKEIEYKWYKTPEQREKERLAEREKGLENKKEEEDFHEDKPIVFTKVEDKDEEDIK